MSERITSIRELLIQAAAAAQVSGCEKAWIYAIFTDSLFLKEWNPTGGKAPEAEVICRKEKKLLELRIFWEEAEYKAFRGSIGNGNGFYYRIITDDSCADFYDETQYLTGSEGRLTVRNYVSYYENSGQAYVSDFRMVKKGE